MSAKQGSGNTKVAGMFCDDPGGSQEPVQVRRTRQGSQAQQVYAALKEIGGDRRFRYAELLRRSGAGDSICRAVLHQLLEYEAVRSHGDDEGSMRWYWYADASWHRRCLLTRVWNRWIFAEEPYGQLD